MLHSFKETIQIHVPLIHSDCRNSRPTLQYRLYEYTFHRPQKEVSINESLKVNVPPEASLPYPNPLEEAVENDVFYKLLQGASSSPQVVIVWVMKNAFQ